MTRTVNVMLLTASVVLALLNILVFTHGRGGRAAHSDPPAASDRWQALTPAGRLECVQRYQALARRPDARTVLRQACEFSEMPSEEQDRLRAISQLLERVLDRQSPAGRRELLRLSPRARAYFVYREVVAELPAWLAQYASLHEEGADRTPPGPKSEPGEQYPAPLWDRQ